MSTYLVDYENVRHHGMVGVEQLNADDRVFVFYANKSHVVPITTFEAANISPARIEIINSSKSSKNYLDFQIATFIGSIVEAGDESELYIISKDVAYDAVIDFWQQRKELPVIKRILTLTPPLSVVRAEAGAKATANADTEAPADEADADAAQDEVADASAYEDREDEEMAEKTGTDDASGKVMRLPLR